MTQENIGPIRQGVRWLRDLFLPSSGLMIGEARLFAKPDANANIDPHWGRADGTEMNLTGEVLFCRATSNLTLTTTAQSITGDGDSSKVRLLLPTIGEWTIEAVCNFVTATLGVTTAAGLLYVNDSGSAETGAALKSGVAVDNVTAAQRWKVTTTAADTPVELKANKSADTAVILAMSEHTTLTASIGAGGGSTVETVDHGALTGRGDDDHPQYGQLADAETVPGIWDFTGGLKADTISESTGAAGVTIEGIKLEDANITTPSGNLIIEAADTVTLRSGTDVTDGVAIQVRDTDDNVYRSVFTGVSAATPIAQFGAAGMTMRLGIDLDCQTFDLTNCGNIAIVAGKSLSTDSILETTPGLGVTIEGALLQHYTQYQEITTPANPDLNYMRIFARASGENIQLIARSSQGAEAVLATLDDTAGVHTNKLALNWVE